MFQGGGWQSSSCEQGHQGLHTITGNLIPLHSTLSQPQGCGWCQEQAAEPCSIPTFQCTLRTLTLLFEVNFPPATQNSPFVSSNLKIFLARSGGRKGAACRALLSLMCKSQLPKTQVDQWKRPLGVGEGSSWPFLQPGSMLLCTVICLPDFYFFQWWVAMC